MGALGRQLAPYRWRLIAAAIALIFTAGATLTLGKGLQVLIDRGFAGDDPGALGDAVRIVMLITTAIAVGTFFRFYLVSWLGERISADLRSAVFRNIVRLHPGFFEENRSGEIMSRLTADTTVLQTIIGSSMSMALRSTLTLSGAVIMMLVTNFKLTLFIVATVPLVLLPVMIFGRRVRKLSSSSQDSVASVGSYAGEIIQNIRTVQGFNREAAESEAFDAEVEKAFVIARSRVRQRALLIAFAIIILSGGMIAMMYSGGRDVISGAMTGGELAAFMFYAVMVGTGFATLSEVWGDVQRAAGATERLLELVETDSALPDTGDRESISQNPNLELRNVSFSYPSRPDTLALNNISLHIEAGKSLALVGPSGAGKTTLFELLQRFYDPQSGALLLDGIDLREMSLEQLRTHLAIVPQQPTLFSADVRYNIAYGNPDASDAEIQAAAQRAHAHEFIEALPEGYSSFLGEQGVRLSGGQRQRIALARAMLTDPKVLLLDEATSALDAESEYQVQQAISELMHERTTVIIAHRLATIRDADCIAVLDEGKVVATGTHDELLGSSELYARLAKLQFRNEAA
ncbi:ABC transporter transmembrane domain-containing protein [Congregibacter litoralis]|uniref:ABC transporter transmembrane domain-containing protein n=1 Tax=Congregibacter litoralis TaxID=393662 RepID=UPI000A00634C|nr:ABC transporter transmembrane domain-containing protein [Congregibacter litoralis]